VLTVSRSLARLTVKCRCRAGGCDKLFEGLVRPCVQTVKKLTSAMCRVWTYAEALQTYGSDTPDIRFGMTFVALNDVVKGKGFPYLDSAELVVGICAEGCRDYTRNHWMP